MSVTAFHAFVRQQAAVAALEAPSRETLAVEALGLLLPNLNSVDLPQAQTALRHALAWTRARWQSLTS